MEAALLAEPDFAVTVGDIRYTERTDGGTAMLEAAAKRPRGESVKIGSFKGFALLVEKKPSGQGRMVLRGRTDYGVDYSLSPVGSMVKLENLFQGIPYGAAGLESAAAEYERDLEQSKQEYEKPFAQEKELEEKTARLNELNVELDLENGVFDIGDMDPYEENTMEEAPEAGMAAEQGRVAEPGYRYGTGGHGRNIR